MNALMMKIAARHRQEFNKPKPSGGSGGRFHFPSAYFRKSLTSPMPQPMLAEDDDEALKRAGDLYKKYGKRYSPPPPGHSEHNEKSWKKSLRDDWDFQKNPNNRMKHGIKHVHNAGSANEEFLHNHWAARIGHTSLGADENEQKEWREGWRSSREKAMYSRNVRNMHLKKETNEKRRGPLPQIGIREPNKNSGPEPAQEQNSPKNKQEPSGGPSNNPGMSRAAKIGLGVAGVGVAAYGAHKLRKYLKKRKEQSDQEATRAESEKA